MPPRLSAFPDAIRSHYDAVIVGSGYGGSVAALRLAQAGLKVCLLERGREFHPGDFPTGFFSLQKQLQVATRYFRFGDRTGLFHFRWGRDIHLLMGCGLGGGSLINAALAMPPDKALFTQSPWPEPVAADGLLAKGVARAQAMLRPRPCPDPERYPKFRALSALAQAMGEKVTPASLAIAFDDGMSVAQVPQTACTGCGDCWAGCNVGAKTTLAETYLPLARRHGAQIFTQVHVRHITGEPGAWRVVWERAGRGGGPRSLRHITAPMVILAAGVLGTTEILMRSREKGLALSDRLGEGISANGDLMTFAFDTPEIIHAMGVGAAADRIRGPGPGTLGMITFSDVGVPGQTILVEDGVLISPLVSLAPLHVLSHGKPWQAIKTLYHGAKSGPLSRTQVFLVVGPDNGKGRLVLERDRVQLVWEGAASHPYYQRAEAFMKALAEQAEGVFAKLPLSEPLMGSRPVSVHPLGGCAMGEDRKTGVVDHKGRLFDGAASQPDGVHAGLYVCDGALIPAPLGINPLLTITALAERILEHLCRDHDLPKDFGDRPLPDAHGNAPNSG